MKNHNRIINNESDPAIGEFMSSLKLKVPPPVVLLISALLMWLLSMLFPTSNEPLFRVYIAAIMACIGILTAVTGILLFRKSATTINPLAPEQSTTLVIGGIYKFTRNPMYLGLLFVLLSWSVFLFNLYATSILIVFVFYITEFQIKPEEEALAAIFGEDYKAYMKSVRRWL